LPALQRLGKQHAFGQFLDLSRFLDMVVIFPRVQHNKMLEKESGVHVCVAAERTAPWDVLAFVYRLDHVADTPPLVIYLMICVVTYPPLLSCAPRL
jgi:hypothetical protein